jgi:hypothetical protein
MLVNFLKGCIFVLIALPAIAIALPGLVEQAEYEENPEGFRKATTKRN